MDPWIRYTYNRILKNKIKVSEITMGFMPSGSWTSEYLIVDKVNDEYDKRHDIKSVTLQKFINTGADIDKLKGNSDD